MFRIDNANKSPQPCDPPLAAASAFQPRAG
jgi:hypothetical protein